MARIARKPETGAEARWMHKAKKKQKKFIASSWEEKKALMSDKAKKYIQQPIRIKESGPQKYQAGGRALRGYGRAYMKGGRAK